jgi:hypothetical protein
VSALSEFILARIAEDEAAANAPEHETLNGLAGAISTGDDPWPSERAFAERFTPDHVLRECLAKRNLVDWAEQGGNQFVLCQLAGVYDGHPEWCEDWRQGPTASYGDD